MNERVFFAGYCWIGIVLTGIEPAFSQQPPANKSSVFGTEKRSEAALIGILYDLKQNQKHEPQNSKYVEVIGNFAREGWDEGILNRYFRVTRPLYTTQIFIPTMGAEYAPKAFGAEKEVEPSEWVIHYKGQVSPPHAGTYRFVGVADDILLVAISGKTVLIGTHPGSGLENAGWKKELPREGPSTPVSKAVNGDWITLKEGEIVDIDIMIGERPGGQFAAWLMVEQQGVSYPPGPVLPVFQLALQSISSEEREPKVTAAKPDELWRCYQ